MNKSFKTISWDVTEEVYRADKALSYSTIAKYKRSGFNNLSHLFDKIETPSLTFGSAVDSLITGGEEEFNSRFMVADFPIMTDSRLTVVKALFNEFNDKYDSIKDIPDSDIILIASYSDFQKNWKPETRARVLKEEGEEYYKLLYLAKDKTILNTTEYQEVINAVEVLKNSTATEKYFSPPNPFEPEIEKIFQPKFRTTFNGVPYRCMADAIIVDHKLKKVIPIDLKTSSKPEWDFYKSFIDWDYMIQARLYWRIIRKCMDEDPYFKDFELLDYRFIVVNRYSLTPLVWEYEDTQKMGTLYYGKNKEIECKDPFELGEELNYYLTHECKVPKDINPEEPINLTQWLNKL